MLRIGLATGARIVVASPFARQQNTKLLGTELLLSAAGRAKLVEHYHTQFRSGSHAVCTAMVCIPQMN